MESVCSGFDNDCIYLSSVSGQDWINEDFVDDGHMSRKGGEKLASLIAEEVLSNFSSDNID
jgi:hypothetical protein